MKYLFELNANSKDLLERQGYASRLKTILNAAEQSLKDTEEALVKEKQFIKSLKTQLAEYDVYRQKVVCSTCKELDCICEEVLKPSLPF